MSLTTKQRHVTYYPPDYDAYVKQHTDKVSYIAQGC